MQEQMQATYSQRRDGQFSTKKPCPKKHIMTLNVVYQVLDTQGAVIIYDWGWGRRENGWVTEKNGNFKVG